MWTWHLLLSFFNIFTDQLSSASAQIQARLTADCIEDFTNSSLTVMVVWYSHALKQLTMQSNCDSLPMRHCGDSFGKDAMSTCT